VLQVHSDPLLSAARAIAVETLLKRGEIEKERCLPSSLIETLRAAQMFELWLPAPLVVPNRRYDCSPRRFEITTVNGWPMSN